jgi:hypothetical protein
MPTVASNEAVASAVPDGDHVIARTVLEWPVSIVPAFLNVQLDGVEAAPDADEGGSETVVSDEGPDVDVEG